jgi:pimeloyl-ACP methyl ester carboxylesterase
VYDCLVRAGFFALLAVLAVACTASFRVPDLGGLYNRAAREQQATRNPIIVIPGILGSRLRDQETGRLVWGSFVGDYANPTRADGARLISLPMRDGAPLRELRDGAEAEEVLDRVRVSWLRLPIEQKAYFRLLASLGAGGYRDQSLAGFIDYGDDHFTCFQFPYDWRRDNVESAQQLHEFILEKRAYVAHELALRYGIENADVRFDIVAHSMGGLVTRYYLRYGAADLPDDGSVSSPTWAGARYVERAVLVGTPNAGAVDSLMSLVDGRDFSWILPTFSPSVLGTMPSLYQLLPRARHARVLTLSGAALDPLDLQLWERLQWGLAAPDQAEELERLLPYVSDAEARRGVALDHLAKSLSRARGFQRALDVPSAPPPGLSLHLIAGDSEPTDAVLEVDKRGELSVIAREPGDGTVLRTSAVLDERVGGAWSPGLVSPIAWERVTFLFRDHLGLTQDPAFTDNLLFMLLEEPR